ncbi:hypothetical protein NJLHNGOC_08930 [Novacetimonas cocois]|uniref:Uncharacterized protein n=1 Tax=Novacetimonas cocois TaxID=1747507 RepID=A0A365YUS0_9PROT|nr:hypothetical protein NJLHNGOC_08930 [Novacetimonas cocois]
MVKLFAKSFKERRLSRKKATPKTFIISRNDRDHLFQTIPESPRRRQAPEGAAQGRSAHSACSITSLTTVRFGHSRRAGRPVRFQACTSVCFHSSRISRGICRIERFMA